VKILLVGEYSGLHLNLYEGLLNYPNMQVDLMSDGDGFKKFERTIDIKGISKNKLIYTITRIIKEIYAVIRLKEYDVIQVINPLVFSRFGPAKFLIYCLRKKTNKLIMLAVGDDSYYWKAYREGKFLYSPHPYILDIDGKQGFSCWETRRYKFLNNYLIKVSDVIVPGLLEYSLGYANNPKLHKVINFPVNLEKLPPPVIKFYSEGEKIKIIHGVQKGREGFKGTNFIDLAMDEVLIKYRDLVEYIRVENIPFQDYIKILNQSHIIIDQVNGYGSGMNSLFSLAMGKIVLGGNEQIEDYDNVITPVFNITPNVKQIISVLEEVISLRNEFHLLSKKSIDYIQNNHSHFKIALEYIDLYKSIK
jgi:hypothetical protein